MNVGNPPRIWLTYRPVRIGWAIEPGSVSQLLTAASWNTCLWGGRMNPIVSIGDVELATNLIANFGVDVLIPVANSDAINKFVTSFPHLEIQPEVKNVFHDGCCEFADIRNAVSRTADKLSIIRYLWSPTDPLAGLFGVLLGHYPSVTDIMINYPEGIRGTLELSDIHLSEGDKLLEVTGSITPLSLTMSGIVWRTNHSSSSWLSPGIVLGDAAEFDDLILYWNLRSAGADVWFYDHANAERLRPSLDAFVARARGRLVKPWNRFNLWSRSQKWDCDISLEGLNSYHCRGDGTAIWNGLNIIPVRPRFSFLRRDVVPAYSESDDGAVASFALPDQPFNFEDPSAIGQRFVATVEANPYGPASEDLTFHTPHIPRLNDFYGRNSSYFEGARAEPGDLGSGALGFITSIGTQRLEISAIRVHQWMQQFFSLFGIVVEHSEPGRRCSRLIRQLDGIQGCRVLKVRGARALIRKYGPDQSFTRSGAVDCIRDIDPVSQKSLFGQFENLKIRSRQPVPLTPDEVLQYLVSRRVFRVGLDFKCPNCFLQSWISLDDVKTISTCIYCGQHFDVTAQLKDRDWRYRRSGLFGRDDNQLGGIPVALAIQQLDTTLRSSLLMYSTALNFTSKTAKIETCEADFVAVVGDRSDNAKPGVQILIGEAKTSSEFDANDVRRLGLLADAILPEIATAFIMFAKTGTFTEDELSLAQRLNSPDRIRVILWSQEELEPYFLYQRSENRVGDLRYASRLIDMVRVTNQLFFDTHQTP